MFEAKNELKLLSLSEAASIMSIGRDNLRRLIREGKIGFIQLGSSRRIPYQELIRFQSESTVRKSEPSDDNPTFEQNKFNLKNRISDSKLNSKQMLTEIIRKEKDGNCKTTRGDTAHTMV